MKCGYQNRPRCLVGSGSVLILALWVVFFLAALTLATGAHVAAVLSAAERLTERTRAQAEATGAAAYAAAVIMSQTNTWDGISQSAWNCDERVFHDVEVSETRISVSFASPEVGGKVRRFGVLGEESRININYAKFPVLTAFFMTVAELGKPEAEKLATEVFIWRGDSESLTSDDGKVYPSSLTGLSAEGRPLRSPEELLLVKGVDEGLFRRIQPFMTVYGKGKVNINAASETVLEVLGVAAAQSRELAGGAVAAASLAAKIVRFREAGNAFEKSDNFNVEDIRIPLKQFEPLIGDELEVLGDMVASLTDRSDSFGGTAYGGGGSAVAEPTGQIDFVWDVPTRRFVMWRVR